MKFVEVKKSEIENGFYKKTKLFKFLTEFRDSGLEAARVEWEGHYKNPYSCQSSLCSAIKTFRLLNIEFIARNGKIYLVKKDGAEE